MNCAFEDCYILYNLLKESTSLNIHQTLEIFSTTRSASTNTLADLCLEHYHDMAANTMSIMYLVQKRLESYLYSFFPSKFIPLYSMVAFSNIPYNAALKRAQSQDKYIGALVKLSIASVLAITTSLLALQFRNGGSFANSIIKLSWKS
jgi:kynurenine 3-monooxygenase